MVILWILLTILAVGLVATVIAATQNWLGWQTLWVVTAVVLAIVLAALMGWPGWLRVALFPPTAPPAEVAIVGCINKAEQTPSGGFAVYQAGESVTLGTRTYECIGDPNGDYGWVPVQDSTQAADPNTADNGAEANAPKGECKKDALTASHDDNLSSGRYEMSYFGGTSEACYMFGEFNFGVADQTWLIVVPPNWTFNLAGFIGETMWYRESEGAVDWSIQDSTANLTRPDGRDENDPIIVWVNNPDDLKLLPSVAEYEVIEPLNK